MPSRPDLATLMHKRPEGTMKKLLLLALIVGVLVAIGIKTGAVRVHSEN